MVMEYASIIKATQASSRAIEAMSRHMRAIRDARRANDTAAENKALLQYERAKKRYETARDATLFPWER